MLSFHALSQTPVSPLLSALDDAPRNAHSLQDLTRLKFDYFPYDILLYNRPAISASLHNLQGDMHET